MAASPPPSARRHYAESALLAQGAARAATAAAADGVPVSTIASTVALYQAAGAVLAQDAIADMLLEQAINEAAEAILDSVAFTTPATLFEQFADEIAAQHEVSPGTMRTTDRTTQADIDAQFAQMVESLVQNATRAAESVSVAVRPRIVHVRYLDLPSCSRCAVLAGRVYRWSEGFLRHPNCDCVMIPTTVANDQLVQDPAELMAQGLVTGLSKRDQQAITDGADFGKVVNVRLSKAGLTQAGRVLYRRGRLTPEGIYAQASTRDEAVELLKASGYIL